MFVLTAGPLLIEVWNRRGCALRQSYKSERQVWAFNDPDEANMIAGDAAEFCHVVTQGRNIKDVNLEVKGESAEQWMAIAQCFAGPPEDPRWQVREP